MVRRSRRIRAVAVLSLTGVGCAALDDLMTPAGSLAIKEFRASPAQVARGGVVTLRWSVEAAITVAIDNGIGAVVGAVLALAGGVTVAGSYLPGLPSFGELLLAGLLILAGGWVLLGALRR